MNLSFRKYVHQSESASSIFELSLIPNCFNQLELLPFRKVRGNQKKFAGIKKFAGQSILASSKSTCATFLHIFFAGALRAPAETFNQHELFKSTRTLFFQGKFMAIKKVRNESKSLSYQFRPSVNKTF